MTLNYVTLTLDLYDGQGNPVISGSAAFTPSAVLTDAGVEIIGQQPITAVFHAGGLPAVKLLATDNSAPQPPGWTWLVTFSGIAGAPAAFSFFLPFTGGASQLLSNLIPVQSGTSFQAYMPLPSGTPSSGQVPVATGSGEASAWGAVPIAGGGTGQVTQQAAIDALAGAVTSGLVLRGNGTHVQLAALQAADIPDLAYVDSVSAADSSVTVTGAPDTPSLSSVPAQLTQRIFCV